MPNLSFLEHYRTIIKTPSISAFDEKLNMSNKSLIDILLGWFSDLGFSITIQLVPGAGNQFNMLAKIGTEKEVCCFVVIQTPCPVMKVVGNLIPLKSNKQMANFLV
jgi:hypothetical protein